MSDNTAQVGSPGALLTRDSTGSITNVPWSQLAFTAGLLEALGIAIGRDIPVDGNAAGSFTVLPTPAGMAFNGVCVFGAGIGFSPNGARMSATSVDGSVVDGSTTNGRPFVVQSLVAAMQVANPSLGEVNITSGLAPINGQPGTALSLGVNPTAVDPTGRQPVRQLRLRSTGALATNYALDALDDDNTFRDVRAKASSNWGLLAAPAVASSFIPSGGASVAASATEPPGVVLMPQTANITTMFVAFGTAMAVDTLTFILRINGVDVASATVPVLPAATAANVAGLTVAVAAGDKLSVRVTQSAAEVNAALNARVVVGYQ